MNRKNMQNYQMLTRTLEFATNHVGLFPKNSAAAEILDTIKSGVSELSEKGSARVSAESAMRVSRNARTAAREKLHDCLATADRTGVKASKPAPAPPVPPNAPAANADTAVA